MPLKDDLRHLIEYDIFRVKRILRGLVADLPNSLEARLLLGEAHLRGLEFEDAIVQFRAALAADPKSRSAVANLALCAIYTGRIESALTGFDHLHRTGKHDLALILAGVVLHRLGRIDEALARLDSFLAAAPETSPLLMVALHAKVRVLRDAGKPDAADAASARLMARIADQPHKASSEFHGRWSSYHYHEWSNLADKVQLARLLAPFQEKLDGDLRAPATLVLPADGAALAAFTSRLPQGAILVSKPRGGQGGQGIRLTERLTDIITTADAVVQRYIDPPYLVDGRKAHLRIYGLITSAKPLRCYVYDDGIARLSPEPYQRGEGWLGRPGIHVTNTALHRKHPQLVLDNDPAVEDQGHVWSLKGYLARLGRDGHDPAAVFQAIARLVGRFVLTLRDTGLFDRETERSSPRSHGFKLFGFDVLLDADARPWLIEIQRGPAWSGTPLVNRINGDLADTLVRMTASPLLDPGLTADHAAAIRTDPSALDGREIELETRHRGGFVRLALE